MQIFSHSGGIGNIYWYCNIQNTDEKISNVSALFDYALMDCVHPEVFEARYQCSSKARITPGIGTFYIVCCFQLLYLCSVTVFRATVIMLLF